MVAVAAHHVGHVALYPFFEEVVCALIAGVTLIPTFQPLALRELPFVARFVHDEQAQRIAEIVDHWRLRVVAHANGIHADVLQILEPPLPHVARDHRTEHSGIVVQAYTLYLHIASVNGKTFVGREVERTQSHSHQAAVYSLTRPCITQQSLDGIEVAAADIPLHGLLYLQRQRAALTWDDNRLPFCHLPTHGVANRDVSLQLRRLVGIALSDSFHVNLHGGGTSIHLLQPPSATPLCEMHGCCLDEPHGAIDAATCIPARVSLPRMVHTHGNHVLAHAIEIGCHIVEHRRIAVGTHTEQMTIEIDLGAAVDSLKIDIEVVGG